MPLDTVLIEVAVRDRDPQQAARIADALGKQFTTTVADLERRRLEQGKPRQGVGRPGAHHADVAGQSQAGAQHRAGSACSVSCIGAGLALLSDMLDTTIKGEQDVALVTDSTVIGGIGYDGGALKRPLIVQSDPHNPRAEAFRALRTNLQFVDAANHPRSLDLHVLAAGGGQDDHHRQPGDHHGRRGRPGAAHRGATCAGRGCWTTWASRARSGLTNVLIGQAEHRGRRAAVGGHRGLR